VVTAPEFTVGFPFCGLGAGARGFLDAQVELFGQAARFRSVGGIDFDPDACKDFVALTDSPALCADVAQVTPAQLRDLMGDAAPDVIFLSAPCKGSSKLLSAKKARDPRYEAMNRLAEVWIDLMLRTWTEPVKLVLFENVPNITTRARAMLARVKACLRAAGYILHDGFHECGEIGGLAQRRRRWLMVARHPGKVPSLLYQPLKKRVRGCGEVLGALPLPGDPGAGPMHKLPAISWLNWVRLALIPAGGDWRDLPGVVPEGGQRRGVFKRHAVERWEVPTGTIAGSGSNSVQNVADPRIPPAHPLCAVAQGAYAVADPRCPKGTDSHAVRRSGPSHESVLGESEAHSDLLGVDRHDDARLRRSRPSTPTTEKLVRGESSSSCAPCRVGDPCRPDPDGSSRAARLRQPAVRPTGSCAPASWDACREHARGGGPRSDRARVAQAEHETERRTGASDCAVDGAEQGAGENARRIGADDLRHPKGAHASEGDPRVPIVIDWREAERRLSSVDPDRFAKNPPVIVAEDGTWHRPMTTLELAALQGLPTTWKGRPLVLAGAKTGAWRERIGNAVPVQAAEAVARQMLLTLSYAAAGAFALSSGEAVWVVPEGQLYPEMHA
jgi:site-specific DNA-cytosine methylase